MRRYQLAGIVFHFPRVYWLPFPPFTLGRATLKRGFLADLRHSFLCCLRRCEREKNVDQIRLVTQWNTMFEVSQKAAHCDAKLSHSANDANSHNSYFK